MSLTEIEDTIVKYNIVPVLLEAQMMKSIQWADQWIGYDDGDTFSMKKAWANNYCFGGTSKQRKSRPYYEKIGFPVAH
jgi:chitinase